MIGQDQHALARRLVLAGVCLLAALVGAPAAGQDDLAARADAAWLSGDHDAALTLYERLLAESPDDRVALTRTGLVHFWAGRYDTAEQRLRRTLEIVDDRDARLALGRLLAWSERYDEAHEVLAPLHAGAPPDREALLADSLALAWGRRFDEAAVGFERLLAADPDDRQASLGLARALAWGGRYREAEAHLRRHLEKHRGDADALSLMANMYGWWGRYDAAEAAFIRLSGFPGRYEESAAGEAKVARWSGRNLWARHRTNQGLESFPGSGWLTAASAYQRLADGDVPAARRLAADVAEPGMAADLVAEIDRARGPHLRAGLERWSDTDENDHDIARAGLTWRPVAPLELLLDLERIDAASEALRANGAKTVDRSRGDATATTGRLGVRLWPGARTSLHLHGGRVEYERFDGSQPTHTVGGLTVMRRPGRLEYGAAWAREAVPWTAILIDNDLTWDRWRLFARFALFSRWELGGEISGADIEGPTPDDDNGRDSLSLEALWHLRGERPRLALGFAYRTLDDDRDTDNGYFDPADFRALLAEARLGDTVASGKLRWRLRVGAGVQEFERGGRGSGEPVRDFGSDAVVGGDGALEIRAGARGGWIVLTAGYTDYAAQSATGFDIRHAGISWRRSP